MSRGRGQRHALGAAMGQGAQAPKGTPAPTGGSTSSPALQTRFAKEKKALDAMEQGRDSDLDAEAFWKRNQVEMRGLLEPLFLEALRANDLNLARRIGAEQHVRLGQLTKAADCITSPHADDARLLVAAVDHLRTGFGPEGSKERTTAVAIAAAIDYGLYSDWHRVSSENLAYLRRLALAREESEINYPDMRPAGRIFEDLDSALRSARADILGEDLREPVTVDVRLDFEAFQEFRLRYDISNVHAADEDYRGPAAVSHLRCVLGRQSVRIRALHTLTPGPWMTESTVEEIVASRLHQAGECQDFRVLGQIELDAQLPVVSEWDGASGVGGQPGLAEERVFGEAGCRHENGYWRLIGADMHLACPDCFTSSVVRIPLHRCPPGTAIHEAVSRDDGYLSERRFWDAVHDRPLDLTSTLEELRQRDGYADWDSSAYATSPQSSRPAFREQSVRSVAAAMNRR